MKMLKCVLLVLCTMVPVCVYSQSLSEDLNNKVSTIMEKKFLPKTAHAEVEQTLDDVRSQIGTDNETFASLLEFYISKVGSFDMDKERLDSLYDEVENIRERISKEASPVLEALYLAHAKFLGLNFFGNTYKKKKEIETYVKWWELHKNTHPDLTTRDTHALENFCSAAFMADEKKLAKELSRELHEIYQLIKEVTDEDYQRNICALALFTVTDEGKNEKAIKIAQENVESLRAALSDTICEMYYKAIDTLGTCFSTEDSSYLNVLSIQTNLAEQLYGSESFEYQMCKNLYSTASLVQGEFRQALDAKQFSQDTSTEISLDDWDSLANINYLYGRYSEALKYHRLHLDYLLEHPDAETHPYAGSTHNEIMMGTDLQSIINLYVAINDLDGLLEWAEETLPRTWAFGDICPQKYALRVAESAASSKKSEYAARFVALIDKYVPQYDGEDAIFIMRDKAFVYTYFLDGEKGPEMLGEAFKLANTSELKARIKLEQALSYFMIGNMPMVSKTIKEALKAILHIPNYEQTQEYIAGLNLSLISNIIQGDFSAALEDVIKSEKYQSISFEEAHIGLPSIYKLSPTSPSAQLEGIIGQFSIMILAFVKSSGLIPMVVDTYLQNGMPQKTQPLVESFIEEYRSGIFSTLVTSSQLSKQTLTEMQEQYLPFLARYAASVREDYALEHLMDAALLCKSLQLNAENAIRDIAAKSSDPEVRNLYDRLLELRNIKAQQVSDTYDIEIMEIEMQLKNEAKLNNDYVSLLKRGWREIASRLRENEAVVEFVNYPTFDDDTKYIAVVMRKDGSLRLVDLFGENELQQTDQEQWYQSSVLTDMIWQPLSEAISDVSKLYVSPISSLHTIALESLPEMSKYVPQLKQIVRLSTSLELLKDKNYPSGEVILIGGIDYDQVTQQVSKKKSKKRGQRGIGDYLQYLPGTKTEVENTKKILSSVLNNISVVTGCKATESWFKSLSGKDLRILHIATHGFYLPQEREVAPTLAIYGSFKRNINESELLRQSGLYLAGANNALIDSVLTNGDDGVITSEEITSLDLLGTELVTLSACNTAQGDISGDGVFGLQRAFKKAGVNSILMALWPVDDEATQKLMENFYTGLAKGMTKQEALEQAKKVIRETPGFESPEYWAAFILLDALD